MKAKKHRIRNLLLEILGELVVTALFFGLGWLILRCFGIDVSWDSELPDLAIFLGAIVFIAVFLGIILLAHRKIKK